MTKATNKQLPVWIIDKLPVFDNAEYIPQRFSDSTHELWRLKLSQDFEGESKLFLKICQNTNSPFWQILDYLFGLNLSVEIGKFEQLYASINRLSPLKIPELLKAETIADGKAYILTSELKGSALDASGVNLKMVQQLAEYITALHRNHSSEWGKYSKADRKQGEWPERLGDTLLRFAKASPISIPGNILEQALNACKGIDKTTFVPMMTDLRWDQFHHHRGELFALLDLDAFVLAPRELDLILLEYILTVEQSQDFIKTYSRYHDLPDLTQVRPAYRLLFFLMEVLGEQDIHDWMNKEYLF